MENENIPTQGVISNEKPVSQPVPALPPGNSTQPVTPQEMSPEQKRVIVGIIIGGILLLAFIIVSIIFLLNPAHADLTAQIRDIFLIFMAIESLLIGLTLVVLMVQMARLINLLQNEIKPILDSTNETVSHLRGTTVFLSNNLVEPVIKLNEYLAGFAQFFQVLGLVRKPSKKNTTTKGV
jgi:hypothetical protein